MRLTGTLCRFDEARGFGFIEPEQGGQEIFVHAKAFGRARPAVGQRVTFEIELDGRGRKRAKAVEPLRVSRPPRRPVRPTAAPWSAASYAAIFAFVIVYGIVALLWSVPAWVAGLYAITSVAAFVAYRVDKARAEAAPNERIPESTLLTLGFVGGWPGAILAQQRYRHKTRKASFVTAFWFSVAGNVIAFVALASPLLRPA